jgi:cytochrome c553
MEHFTDKHHLTRLQDVADVAAFVSDMPVTRASGHGSGEYLRHGEQPYGRVCSSCHGPAAEGSERYPRLAGQHYEYLLRQMHDIVEGRRHSFQTDHMNLPEPFEPADFACIADYLSRLSS